MTNRTPDAPRIDGDRLLRRIEALATIGPIDGGGSCRLALTDEDREGRDLVVAWMHDLDLDVRVDGIGNVVGVRPGRTDGPPVMTGSHIDTVRTGGRYDGNLGVLAGLEVIETLEQQGIRTEHPFAVAFFTDEEGSRFPPDMLGSLVYVGGMAVEEALDIVGIDGAVVGEELDRIGYQGPFPCPGPAPRARSSAGSRGYHYRSRYRRPGHLLDRTDRNRPVQPRRDYPHGPPSRPGLRSGGHRPPRSADGSPDGWTPGSHRGAAGTAPQPGQRGGRLGIDDRGPAQHRRATPAGGRG